MKKLPLILAFILASFALLSFGGGADVTHTFSSSKELSIRDSEQVVVPPPASTPTAIIIDVLVERVEHVRFENLNPAVAGQMTFLLDSEVAVNGFGVLPLATIATSYMVIATGPADGIVDFGGFGGGQTDTIPSIEVFSVTLTDPVEIGRWMKKSQFMMNFAYQANTFGDSGSFVADYEMLSRYGGTVRYVFK